jgi:hypothetical protein
MGDGDATTAPDAVPEGATPFRVPEGATSIEVPKAFSALKVVPKEGEANDANFPPHLHAAVELFCFAKMPECAKKLATAVNAYLAILSAGPDGKGTNGMGQAAVCWECGHCGLPGNQDECGKGKDAKCGDCGSSAQTNMVKVTQPDGTVVPWIEPKQAPAGKAEEAAAAADAVS